jgi:alkylhydroperoxidase family enzyme
VLADYRSAPIDERLRAALAFLQKVTLEPEAVGPDDAAAARAAGVSTEALRDALYVCAYFNLIDRLADSFGFTPVSDLVDRETMLEYRAAFLARGYV